MTTVDRTSAQYWHAVLGSFGPTAIPRWTLQPAAGVATHDVAVPGDLAASLRGLAEELGLPLGSVVFAAHARVLAALSGETSVSLGYVPRDGGSPLPCRLSTEAASWTALLQGAHRAVTELEAHSAYPIDALRSELELADLVLEDVFDPYGRGLDLAAETVLAVELAQDGGEMTLRLRYRTDALDEGSVARSAGYHLSALTALASDPAAEHARQSLISADERHFLIEGLAGTRRELPDLRFHELFEQQVRAHPDAVAGMCGEDSLTYGALNARANVLARALRARGLTSEGIVAVISERTLDWQAAVIAVFKAGGVYMPIEPHFPADRISAMITRSECTLVLAERGSTTNLEVALEPMADVQTLFIDDALQEGHEDDDLGIEVKPDQLAYVYFTSGSTGEPKGAMCEQLGMLNHMYAKLEDNGVTEGRILAQTGPQCFDISLWQLVAPLLVGGQVLIIEQDVILDVERFVDTLIDRRVSVAQLVPSYIEVVLSYLDHRPRELPDLLCVCSTGEALTMELAQRWFAALPDITLVNSYGLTETSDDTNHDIMERAPEGDRVPLGAPINNVYVYVVDESLAPVPLGSVGEIVLSGICVGRGYINDPERTAMAYVPDPIRPGNRLYRTGDYGRWRPDGKLEFMGRRDAQVKIRGFRIEIGDIENALMRVPGVRNGAVVVADRADGNKRLVGFYSGSESLEADHIREQLAEWLPDYMVPSVIEWMDELPLSGNGKIDRKRLRAIAAELDTAEVSAEPPTTPTEKRLATAWASVLKIPEAPIGRRDSFFELGGTSLSAVMLAVMLDRAVSLRDVARHPVLADLAALVDGRIRQQPHPGEEQRERTPKAMDGSSDGMPGPAAPPRLASPAAPATNPVGEPPAATGPRRVPLTDVQRDVWIMSQLGSKASATYNLAVTLRLKGDLDEGALREALRLLIKRHESLRTTFDATGDHQLVHADVPAELRVVDLADRPAQVQERLEAFVDSELTTRYDLGTAPLFRGTLVRLAEDDCMLVLAGHHIVCDGWSFGVMKRDLGAFYSALVRGEAPSLDPVTQFREFVAWRDPQVADSEAYWAQLYETRPVRLDLPVDHARPPLMTFEFGSERAVIDEQLHAAIGDMARRCGVTAFTVLLAAWELLLHRLSGQAEFASGVFVSGQSSMGADLVGWCAGLLPLRVQVNPEESVRDYLVRLMDHAADGFDHQHVGAARLAAALNMPHDASRPTLVSSGITYETLTEGIAFDGLTAIESVHGRRRYGGWDVEAYLAESEDGLVLDLQYATSLFEPATIRRWLGHYVHLLTEMAAEPTASVSQLQLLEGAQDRELLARWNDTAHAYPDDATVHGLFDAQAERTPDATALVFGGRSVTYAELRDGSNRLAHHLVERGVRVGVPVGIAMRRSPEMIVAMLAVLKAGGAYLPLDPGYPDERLALMIEDAGLELILSGPDVDHLPETRAQTIDVHAFDGSAYPSASPQDGTSPDDPMYVTYTSGSSGRPKGVLGTHRGMLNRVNWQWRTYPFSDGEVCCQKTSLSFVDHLWETWGPLLRGHTLVLFPDEVVADGARFIDLLAECRIERLVAVPSLIATLLKATPDLGTRLSALRYLTLSGERLTNELAAEIETVLPGCVLLNFYGMSEGSADATWYDVRWASHSDTVPIGRPIDNMQVYLLDDERRPVPVGETGEIYLAGVGLAKGYLGRPDLTAERFLADPFGDDPDARMYRSGDLARWRPDGLLEFVGRADHQVKVHGIRIELGEIEAATRSLDGVEDAVVEAPLIGDDRQLVAYVTTAPDTAATASGIRGALASLLPGSMVPSRIIFLDQLPLTPSGKIDRRALPDPVAERRTGEPVAPRTASEQALATIWAQLLGLERVSVDDNFFDLGGDSLLALRVVMEANRAGIGLAPNSIFQFQTIAELASAGGVAVEADEDQGVVVGPTPLSPAQLRFLDERRSPDAHHWNMSTLEAADRLDPTALQAALEAIIRHHDALRLRVWREDGRWRQEIAAPPDALPFASHDLSRLAPTKRQAAIERICTDLQGSMDLEEGLLLRAAHFDCGPDDPDRLFVAVHHFAVDGLTWPLLMEDLETAYRQAESGSSVSLPPKTMSFKAWATQLGELVETPAVVDTVPAWLRLPWPEVAPLPLDFDAPAGANTNASAAAVEVELDAEDTRLLLDGDARPQVVIVTALAACLSDWTGSPAVLVDVLSHGRDAVLAGQDLSRTVGFTLSYNPIVLSDSTWEATPALVESVSAQVGATPTGYTFELLRFLSPDPRLRERLSGLPRADVLFNYRGATADGELPGTWSEAADPSGPDESPRGLRQHPIAVRATLTTTLRLVFTYSTALHRAETVEARATEVAETIRRLSRKSALA